MKKLSRREFEKQIRAHAKKYFGLKLARHQVRWLKHVHFGGQRVLLLAPRRHGKTTALEMVYLSWMLIHDPNLRILFVSHKGRRAQTFSRALREVMANQRLLEEHGLMKGSSWSVVEWQIMSTKKPNKLGHPTVETVGAEGGVSGGSFDWVIIDDLLTRTNCMNEQTRENIKDWVNNEVFNTLDAGPKMKIIVVGTRKHPDDWYGELLLNPDFDCLVDKAIQDDGTALWANSNLNIQELERRKRNDPIGFAHEYQNQPVRPEGGIFKTEWLHQKDAYYTELPPEANLRYYIGVDVSQGSQKKRSTFFSYAVVATDVVSKRMFLIDIYRGKLTVEQQKDKIRSLYKKYDSTHNLVQCIIEAPLLYGQLYGDVIGELHKARAYSPVHDNIGGYRIPDKLMRIETILSSVFERCEISLPNPSTHHFTKLFIDNEYVQFPKGDFDMLDALVYAVADARRKNVVDYLPLRMIR